MSVAAGAGAPAAATAPERQDGAASVRQRVAVIAWVVAGSAFAVVGVAASVLAGASWQDAVDGYVVTNLVVGVGYLASGAFIAWHRPGNRLALVMLIGGLGHLSTACFVPLWHLGVQAGWPEPVLRTIISLTGGWSLGLGGLFPLMLLLFPDGRLPSRRWAPAAWITIVTTAYMFVEDLVSPVPDYGVEASVSILALPAPLPAEVTAVVLMVGWPMVAVAIASLIVRYVRGDERTRRQVLWLIVAVIAMILFNAQRWITGDGPALFLLSFVFVPIAVAIAVVRYQLLDIRIVLRRALLYGIMIALVIAAYAGIVASLSLLVPPSADRLVAIVAALVVAFAFHPVRMLLQRAVSRAFYGTRGDAVATAAGLRLGEADGLVDVLEQARVALRLPRLEVIVDGRVTDAAGAAPPDAAAVDLPLVVRGDDVGALRVTLRAGERELDRRDERSLELVAGPLALILREQSLSEQLRGARAQTVEAREQERALLHRDLHDGLGPTLTSAAYRADAATNLLDVDSPRARELLGQARADVGSALAEVRRVVYGLRPIPLDELGLVGAVRERAAQGSGPVDVGIDVDPLPELSPAVELAAYRIVIEALANVQRHSRATRADVRLSALDGHLVVVVDDDGVGGASRPPGVGIRSIIERAEELGGSAEAGRVGDAGWRVLARLPLR